MKDLKDCVVISSPALKRLQDSVRKSKFAHKLTFQPTLDFITNKRKKDIKDLQNSYEEDERAVYRYSKNAVQKRYDKRGWFKYDILTSYEDRERKRR